MRDAPSTDSAPPGAVIPVSRSEARQWLRWVTPLPKHISLTAKRTLSPHDVTVRVVGPAGAMEQLAARRLRDVLQQTEAGQPTAGALEIVLGVCDAQGRLAGQPVPGAAQLHSLPNREQAYVIAPCSDNVLVLTGLDPRGVSYAAHTLGQLLMARLADGTVDVPLPCVTDWPDLAERGVWWYSAYLPMYTERELTWLADLKVNHLETDAVLSIEKDGPATATLDAALVAWCRLRGIAVVPIVAHLNEIARANKGFHVFDVYPEIRALQDAGPSQAICFSHPTAQRVIDEVFTALARTVDSDDLCVWLSESHASCACAQCRQVEQSQLELRVILRAWRAAQQARPSLRLRLLLTEVSYPRNIAIIEHTPPEVGITYYHGNLTYTLARRPMIYPALREAMRGRRLGCYPTLCGLWYTPAPFSGAAYMRERMSEFHQAGVVSLAGYSWPSLRLTDLPVSAAAEYAWNSTGRTPREFVRSWATRQRFPDPERVARWWQLVEEAQRNLYNSHFTLTFQWASIDALLTARQPAREGTAFLAGFPLPNSLEEGIMSLRRALVLAATIPHPRFIYETRYTLAMLEALRYLRELTSYLSCHATHHDAEKQTASALVAQAQIALAQACDSVTAWDRCMALYPDQRHDELETDGEALCNRLDDGNCWARPTVYFLHKISRELAATARKLGLDSGN